MEVATAPQQEKKKKVPAIVHHGMFSPCVLYGALLRVCG